jgi:hypothetical protein
MADHWPKSRPRSPGLSQAPDARDASTGPCRAAGWPRPLRQASRAGREVGDGSGPTGGTAVELEQSLVTALVRPGQGCSRIRSDCHPRLEPAVLRRIPHTAEDGGLQAASAAASPGAGGPPPYPTYRRGRRPPGGIRRRLPWSRRSPAVSHIPPRTAASRRHPPPHPLEPAVLRRIPHTAEDGGLHIPPRTAAPTYRRGRRPPHTAEDGGLHIPPRTAAPTYRRGRRPPGGIRRRIPWSRRSPAVSQIPPGLNARQDAKTPGREYKAERLGVLPLSLLLSLLLLLLLLLSPFWTPSPLAAQGCLRIAVSRTAGWEAAVGRTLKQPWLPPPPLDQAAPRGYSMPQPRPARPAVVPGVTYT